MQKKTKEVEVNRVEPDLQECKILIISVIGQAVKDYELHHSKEEPQQIEAYCTARDFIFDDDYLFDWGEHTINLKFLCDHIEIDLDWLRTIVKKRVHIIFTHDGIIIPEK